MARIPRRIRVTSYEADPGGYVLGALTQVLAFFRTRSEDPEYSSLAASLSCMAGLGLASPPTLGGERLRCDLRCVLLHFTS